MVVIHLTEKAEVSLKRDATNRSSGLGGNTPPDRKAVRHTKGESQFIAFLLQECDRMYLFALRTTNSPEWAKDAIQEACSQILQNPPQDLGKAAGRGFLFKLVRRAALNIMRSNFRRSKREEHYSADRKVVQQAVAQDAVLSAEAVQMARSALAKLPDTEREAVHLCYEQGMNRREAGEILGIPEQTLKDRVNRGLSKIRSTLTAKGYSTVPAVGIGEALLLAGIPSAPQAIRQSIEQAGGLALRSSAPLASKGLSYRKPAAKTSLGATSLILFSAILIAGTGALWMLGGPNPSVPAKKTARIQSTITPESNETPAAQKTAPKASTEPKLLACWDFSKQDQGDLIRVKGKWQWIRPSAPARGRLKCGLNTVIQFPTLLPAATPIMVRLAMAKHEGRKYSQFELGYTKNDADLNHRMWTRQWGQVHFVPDTSVTTYFIDRHSYQLLGDQICGMHEFDQPYPSNLLYFSLNGWDIYKLEIFALHPDGIPAALRDPKGVQTLMDSGPFLSASTPLKKIENLETWARNQKLKKAQAAKSKASKNGE